MLPQCEFYPNGFYRCPREATHQVFVPDFLVDGTGSYVWVCDECLPKAIKSWKENRRVWKFVEGGPKRGDVVIFYSEREKIESVSEGYVLVPGHELVPVVDLEPDASPNTWVYKGDNRR